MTCTVLFLTVKVTGAEYFVLPDNRLHPHTVGLHVWRGIVQSSLLCLSCINRFFCVIHQAKNACSRSVLHAPFYLSFFCFCFSFFSFFTSDVVLVLQLFAWIFDLWNTLGILHFFHNIFFFAWLCSACFSHHPVKQ